MPTADSLTRSPINNGSSYRPSNAGDAGDAARLIYAAWGSFAHYMFCQPDGQRTEALLAALYAERGHRFSHMYATVAQGGKEVAGLLLTIPGHRLLRLTWGVVPAMTRHAGLANGLRFASRWLPFLLRPEAARDELCIDTLSVAPAWRHRGLGTGLLAEAERQAREFGLRACSLSVDLTNPDAQRLYERLGYHVAATFTLARYARAAGYHGFHYMVKPLEGRQV
ncbi:MAG: GNAT family N-acetyltransferase [Chloroflexi bacterium]|nr:GNAT family N-acetyltransferase [Chloroflexota bacterium]